LTVGGEKMDTKLILKNIAKEADRTNSAIDMHGTDV
jgi:hypothetical protein